MDNAAHHEAFERVFSTPDGKYVLEVILSYCHTFEPMKNADPHESLVREARRDVAGMILMELQKKPSDMQEIIRSFTDNEPA